MTNLENQSDATRDDLLQRIELMEKMIAEGRRFTLRHGWIFLLWGLVDLVAMSWRFIQPHSNWVGIWAWPVCLVAGVVLTFMGMTLQRHEGGRSSSIQCRSVKAVWGMTGVALAFYIGTAMVRHLTWQLSYVAALLILVGLGHAVSALILHWRVQGVVAGIWWAGGIAAFFAQSSRDVNVIFLVEMCFGMILFGLYAMMLERRNGGGLVKNNG
jgi:hypothetical protein